MTLLANLWQFWGNQVATTSHWNLNASQQYQCKQRDDGTRFALTTHTPCSAVGGWAVLVLPPSLSPPLSASSTPSPPPPLAGWAWVRQTDKAEDRQREVSLDWQWWSRDQLILTLSRSALLLASSSSFSAWLSASFSSRRHTSCSSSAFSCCHPIHSCDSMLREQMLL